MFSLHLCRALSATGGGDHWRCGVKLQYFREDLPDWNLKAMDPEIARNQNYDDHYANDGKDVHFVPLQTMMMARSVL
jgi:hypothetical protein